MRKYLLSLAIFGALLGFSSCINDSIDDQPKGTVTNVKELVATDGFTWKTTNEVKLTLIGSNNMVVSVITDDGQVCFKGLLKNEQTLVANIVLKSSDKRFQVKYGPATKTFDVNASEIVCNFNE